MRLGYVLVVESGVVPFAIMFCIAVEGVTAALAVSKSSSAFATSDFRAPLVVRAFRGVAIFRAAMGVADLLGETERVERARVARRDVWDGSETGDAFSISNLGGIVICVFTLSLFPFSIGAGSSNASIQCRIEYSSESASAALSKG